MAASRTVPSPTENVETGKKALDDIWTRPGTSWAAFAGKDLLRRAAREKYRHRYNHARDVAQYLAAEPAYTQLAPRRQVFRKPHYSIAQLYHLVELDLIETGRVAAFNDGVRYILYAIEAGSRKCFVRPLHDKKGPTVARALRSMIDTEFAQIPETVRTDR